MGNWVRGFSGRRACGFFEFDLVSLVLLRCDARRCVEGVISDLRVRRRSFFSLRPRPNTSLREYVRRWRQSLEALGPPHGLSRYDHPASRAGPIRLTAMLRQTSGELSPKCHLDLARVAGIGGTSRRRAQPPLVFSSCGFVFLQGWCWFESELVRVVFTTMLVPCFPGTEKRGRGMGRGKGPWGPDGPFPGPARQARQAPPRPARSVEAAEVHPGNRPPVASASATGSSSPGASPPPARSWRRVVA